MGKLLYCIIIALFISLISISFQGALGYQCKIHDMGEIKGETLEKTVTIKSCERIRFRYEGEQGNLRLKTFEDGAAVIYFWSSFYDKAQTVKMNEFDKQSFDVNDDNVVDFSIIVNTITIEERKRRIDITFMTYEDLTSIGMEAMQAEQEEQQQEANEPAQQPPEIQQQAQDQLQEEEKRPAPTQAPMQEGEAIAYQDEDVIVTYDDEVVQPTPELYQEPQLDKNVMSSRDFNTLMAFLIAIFIIAIIIIATYFARKKGDAFFGKHEEEDWPMPEEIKDAKQKPSAQTQPTSIYQPEEYKPEPYVIPSLSDSKTTRTTPKIAAKGKSRKKPSKKKDKPKTTSKPAKKTAKKALKPAPKASKKPAKKKTPTKRSKK